MLDKDLRHRNVIVVSLQGARSVRRFCTCTLRIPEGLGDLTRKIPKGIED